MHSMFNLLKVKPYAIVKNSHGFTKKREREREKKNEDASYLSTGNHRGNKAHVSYNLLDLLQVDVASLASGASFFMSFFRPRAI